MSFLRRCLLPAFLFVWLLTGCSPVKEDAAPAVNRADLTGKVWTSAQVDFVLDGKTYSEKTPGATGNWTFHDNGTYRTTDEDGQSDQGNWELNGNKIRLMYAGSPNADYLTINRLADKTLVLNLAENLDLTKKESDYSLSELTYFTMAFHYMNRVEIDMTRSRKLSINATLIIK